MPKKQVKAEVNNFIKGLITEASPLNFPANASFDEENFELSRTGTRARRLGMELEPNYLTRNANAPTDEVASIPPTTFEWKGAGGDEDLTIGVVQFHTQIDFYDMRENNLSVDGYLGTITFGTLSPVQFSFAAVDGKLVVVNGTVDIGIISYEGGVFSLETKSLLTRDLWGVEETTTPSYETDISFRGTINNQHSYNLQNQSWGIPRKDDTNTLVDPAAEYNTGLSVYPSNSEIVWTGLQFQAVAPAATPFERMYTNIYQEVLGGNTKAPKGYFIIDVLARGTGRMAQYAANNTKHPTLTPASVTLPNDITDLSGGASVITDFAGRVWYGGFKGEISSGDKRSPNLSNYIFFSQLVKNKQDFVKCYQEGDPTSRENNDVVDTDGGFIRISGMNKLVNMVNLGSNLVVIADNGVWTIGGGSDYGFTPTNIKITKISAFGSIGKQSVIEQVGKVFYWGLDGIYVVTKNQFGEYGVASITETTIQTLYETIPFTSKQQVVGMYDPFSKKLRWLYKTGSAFASADTLELIFDTTINAFSKYRVYAPSPNNIKVYSILFPTKEVQFPRYLAVLNVAGNAFYSFSYYHNAEFRDWPHIDTGEDAYAYLVTGETTGGDSAIPKQIPYLTMHFYRTEVGVDVDLVPEHRSSCNMRFSWDWSNNTVSNKWSRVQEAYRYRKPRFTTDPSDTFDTGFTIVTSKNKIRGRGKSFAMRVNTTAFFDCQIVGWNISADANSVT